MTNQPRICARDGCTEIIPAGSNSGRRFCSKTCRTANWAQVRYSANEYGRDPAFARSETADKKFAAAIGDQRFTDDTRAVAGYF